MVRQVIGDGVPLLLLTAWGLAFAGGFAMFLAASGEFLPHDIRYLKMSAAELCSVADCRVVEFMIHDRAAFGGALFGIGVLYAYLALFPLRRGEAWAWWLLLFSGITGFASFFAYLGYGYLDTWHGIGSLLLLPVYLLGMARSRRIIQPWNGPLVLLTTGRLPDLRSRQGLGKACLLLGAGGTTIGGLVILGVGLTDVFVPEDLAFMRVTVDDLHRISPRLVPLIAHDRVGFGAAVGVIGATALTCLWCAPSSRAQWETLCISGLVSLTAAIGIHRAIGYTDHGHLAPVLAAATSTIIGLVLTFPKTGRPTPQRPT
ncbi:hypothetical protein [Virgisporangium aurantiacum]|uniref:Uncharacterized protein n=1 Tax=Virgisporangium aurantiacum TaxID=175570 RepID=A0A8J3ZHE7_9ACTN|nr:hypothetical protein [Virgisporangium aurantiacum]GIJ62962.1 hypothetical protein Vau01_104780 [Virgisporangium aurantiacum]